MDCDVTKIYRIESGRTVAKPADVQALGFTYGLDRKNIDDLVALSRGAKVRGWTDNYLDMIPSSLSMLADLETEAASIHDYSVEKVHGLLQTEAYARHVIGLADEMDAEKRKNLLSFRLERQQQALTRLRRQGLQFVVHEAALHVEVGSPRTVAEQMTHLRQLDQDGAADIRVWPFAAGLHRWMSGAFTVLEFEGGSDPHVVYIEDQVEARYIETQQHVSRFIQMFGEMRRRSIPIKEYVS